MKIFITALMATLLCTTPLFAKSVKSKKNAHYKIHKKKHGAKLTHHTKKVAQG